MHAVYATESTFNTFILDFEDSIDTKVKYCENSMATVYLCLRPVTYIIQEFFSNWLVVSITILCTNLLLDMNIIEVSRVLC